MTTSRALAVDDLLNLRDLGGLTTADGRQVRPGQVLRSDNLRGLTHAGTAALLADVRPRLVVDLRTADECAREGRGLSEIDTVRYVNVALTPKAAMTDEDAAAGMATNLLEDYVMQVRDSAPLLVSVLSLLSEPEALPAVVHCTAGKDRTGLTVALLLDLLGVERDQVVADYAETAANMPGVLARIKTSPFFRSNGLAAAPSWIFACDPDTMRRLLEHMDLVHGGTERWAIVTGMDPAVPARLRRAILSR